jgi:hypothetical protein
MSEEEMRQISEKEYNELIQEKEKLKIENEKLGIEKEKAELEIQKVELNFQKLKIDYDKLKSEKNKIEKELQETLINNKNEIDKFKSELISHKNLNEKMLTEKTNLINEYKALQKEIDKLKTENSNNTLSKKGNIKSTTNNNYNSINSHSNDAEIIRLKNEIQNLKLQNLQKDEMIKNLKDEKEENEKDKGEDLEFYKKSYEEQKFRVNEEHKLISESLYKLAVHFMSLKDDLQKKINNNNNK